MQILFLSNPKDTSARRRQLQAASNNLRWASAATVDEAHHYINSYYIAAVLVSEDFASGDGRDLVRETNRRTSVFACLDGSSGSQVASHLRYGYDDVFTPVLSATDIMLKMRSCIRRRHGNYQDAWSFFGVGLDPLNKVAVAGDRFLDFSDLEAAILDVLLLNRHRAVRREEMLDYLYLGRELPDDRVLDVTISKIRSKVRSLSGENVIEAVRGVGYQIARCA